MSKRCFYEVLGLARNCNGDELKTAYRKMAMTFHPDRNPDDKECHAKFVEVSEAYEVLKDDQKRAAYDRFGHAAFEQGGMGQARGGAAGFDFGSFTDVFDDLFGEFMGGGRRNTRRQNRGGDLRYNMEITLEDSYRGKSAQIRVPSMVACETCEGTGAEKGSTPETCPSCQGHGKVRAQQGFFTIERTCPKCRGQGRIIKKPCKTCDGAGHVQKERTLGVEIPPGVEDGTRIRLSGEGQAGLNGGPPGDLYIFLSLKAHPIFQRDGHDLHCAVPMSFVTAALGGEVMVPTLAGTEAKVTIPEGVQAGHHVRLRGKGMPALRGSGPTGDLYVEIKVETPVKLTKKQKQMLRDFQAETAANNQPECEGFFAKVKEFLGGDAK